MEAEDAAGGEAEDGDNRLVQLVNNRIHDLTQWGVEWGGRGTILVLQVHAPR